MCPCGLNFWWKDSKRLRSGQICRYSVSEPRSFFIPNSINYMISVKSFLVIDFIKYGGLPPEKVSFHFDYFFIGHSCVSNATSRILKAIEKLTHFMRLFNPKGTFKKNSILIWKILWQHFVAEWNILSVVVWTKMILNAMEDSRRRLIAPKNMRWELFPTITKSEVVRNNPHPTHIERLCIHYFAWKFGNGKTDFTTEQIGGVTISWLKRW